VLRRAFEHKNRVTGERVAWSVSWIPQSLITTNPMISDPVHPAWPGGTMHALSTVGIEIDTIIDEVTATMPTTVEASMWALPEGVPLLWVRRISLDTTNRVVEISDAQYPADRTKLTFHTPLTRWDANC
jgi:GntR family transcriptional regulator